MKKFILSIFLMLFLSGLMAKPLTEKQLNTAVNNFVISHSKALTIMENMEIPTKRNNSIAVYNLKPTGFIVLATDDIMQPVLAYSFTNSLDLNTRSENPFFEIFAEATDLRMEYYSSNKSIANTNLQAWQDLLNGNIRDGRPEQQWPAAGTTSTDGWVETRWVQTGVYNNMCPNDNSGERSVVGCVATAMAMIMDFHKYIGIPNFNESDSFTSYSEGIQIDNDAEEHDFPTFPELNAYLANAAENYATDNQLTNDDLAAINFAAGISVGMNWSSDGSGAYTPSVASALLNKFDYDSAETIDNYGYGFYNVLQENMQNMQPAEISIFTSNWENGHAIIVDGYNTDDYYHLNFGWGTSNSTCWYLLPSGMPSNYSIISNAVVNIEGGTLPISISGNVSIAGTTAENTHIILQGSKQFETIVTNPNGNFEFDVVLSGEYSVTAIKDDGAYYKYIDSVSFDEDNNTLNITLDDFTNFTGQVTAPINPENTVITIYKDDTIISQTTANAQGNYTFHNIIPASYYITASLAGNYFGSGNIDVTAENQNLDLDISEYSGDLATSFASYPASTWILIPNYELSMGVKLSTELPNIAENDVISKVRFKAPISSDQGEIYPQLWKNNTLICEMELNDFSEGDWIEQEFATFVQIQNDEDYFIGYRIISSTSSYAYQDNGPQVEGFGGFSRLTGWNELNRDTNLCIEPIVISNNYGIINGSLDISQLENIDFDNTIVKAGNHAAHPDSNGNFTLIVTPNTYNLVAETTSAIASLDDIEISSGEILNNIELVFYENLDSDNFEASLPDLKLHNNYPNPFNPTTTISFDLPKSGNVKLEIFNSKGQRVKTLLNEKINSGHHSVIWNGKNMKNQNVVSGIYFYRISNQNYSETKKMMLLK